MAQQLSLHGLCISATRPLVNDVSLALNRGRTLALVGSSGSGKSLTCMAALDALPPGVKRTAGSVKIDGKPVSASDLRGSLVATILQNPRLAFNPLRTMRDHINESCRALNLTIAESAVAQVLDEVGLEPQRTLSLFPFEMSGGMLQRMMVAIALLCEAPFIIADEPTTDLDTVAQAKTLDLLEQVMLHRAPGLLLVTHDMGVVARLADDVIVMDHGSIVERGEVGQIFHAPRHPVTRRLIAGHLALYGMELNR
ncbi:nickel import ATP-binding protein NikD [Salmonella enterica subsp. enterica serovar Choleraesuis]|nr:nickel import ATP-binding protein NikD [Salmonella enterica subsp. enterica serovar Choleraesuis]